MTDRYAEFLFRVFRAVVLRSALRRRCVTQLGTLLNSTLLFESLFPRFNVPSKRSLPSETELWEYLLENNKVFNNDLLSIRIDTA